MGFKIKGDASADAYLMEHEALYCAHPLDERKRGRAMTHVERSAGLSVQLCSRLSD